MRNKIRYNYNKLKETENKYSSLEDNEIKVDNLIDLNVNNYDKKIIHLDTEWQDFTLIVLEGFETIVGRDVGYAEFSVPFSKFPKKFLPFINADILLSSDMNVDILKTETIFEIYEDLENPDNVLKNGNIKVYFVIGFLNNSSLPKAKASIKVYNPACLR
jgi:hypothetical protein